jgi:predicted nucleic acid-binding protein
LALARRHHLSSYDAAYLELAFRRQLPVATLDVDLRKAVRRAGIKLF